MPTLPLYQVDAFTSILFHGNPACVVPLSKWLPVETMRRIAAENGVPETAFFIDHEDAIELRWFTPDIEMDLCGHATVATAHVLVRHLGHSVEKPLIFNTKSGPLKVTVAGSAYILDLPSRPAEPATLPFELAEAFGFRPKQVLRARDYMLVFESEEQIRNLRPDRNLLDQLNLDPGGIICTARGEEVDFVSRFFTPQATIFEDPVTGSAHCTLTPFWAERLRKNAMTARQISSRGGALHCTLADDRVLIKGHAVTFMEGKFSV
jgi:PhzF family phenazine biosynthesis protein